MSEVAEALPDAEQAAAGAAVSEETKALTEANRAIDAAEGENKEPEPPPKTPEQQRIEDLERELKRTRRGIDRRTRQLAETRAQLTQAPIERNNPNTADDSQPLSLTRAEIARLVQAEAERLAPTLAEHRQELQRRQGVIESLAKTWGQEKFDEVASDLDEVFGGLQDSSGRPKAAIEAVFEADDPVRVIEWLAHPDNADEAERISKLGAIQAGKAIAKLEAKLESTPTKPRVSKAPPPIAPARGSAPVSKTLADMGYDEFVKRRKAMVAERYR